MSPLLWRLCAVLAAAGVVAAPAVSADTTEALSAEIAQNAFVVEGGQTALVLVGVTCPAGAEVLEAFVYVVQDSLTSDFAPIPVVCDGNPRAYAIRVSAFDQLFHRGRARVSGYVLLESGESRSPTAVVRLR